jgi:hypothetical protein
LPLRGQRPPPQNRAPRRPEWKPLFAGEGNFRFGVLLNGLPIMVPLPDDRHSNQDERLAKGVCQLAGPSQALVRALTGLVRIPQ